MHKPRSASIAVGVALLLASAGQAQVELKSGTVNLTPLATPAERAAAVRSLADNAARDGEAADRHVLVQFDGPLSPETRTRLAAAGLTPQTYVGNFAYVARLADGRVDADAIGAVGSLRGASAMQATWKIHPLAAEPVTPPYAIVDGKNPADPTIALSILFHPDAPMGLQARELVQRHGGTVQRELLSMPVLIAHVPKSAVPAIAAEPTVQWVELPLPEFTELSAKSSAAAAAARNDSNRERVGANILQAPPYNLDGSGITAFIFDAGAVMTSHEAFAPGRATVIDGDTPISHSTHVAGTVGGNGASAQGQLRKGMAPAVSIVSAGFHWSAGGMFLYSDPGDLEADYTAAINNHGVDIANNSIGSNTENNGFPCVNQGDYGITDALIDNIVRGSVSGGEPFRIVWANGNERPGFRCNIEGFGEYRSIAPPAGAKNHMTVGALNSNDDSMTDFSSWGPTDDGRMKPDISAPGCQSNADQGVTSATTGGATSYASLCGTSMASPTVCGVSCLVLQDFRAQFSGAPDPRNSTLRALFAHTAVDLFNPGPDYKSGYGSIRGQAAVDMLRTGRLQEATIDQGGVFTSVVTALPGQPLKVTIAWDDPAATPLALNALVNDLDLRLIDPNGQPHYPWVLDPQVPSADATQNGPNRRDNIEQVFVANPIPGNWTVEVTGFNVPQGPQPFSIIGAGQTTALLVSFPQPLPEFIPPSEPTNIDIRLTVVNQEIEPGSAQFHLRTGGGSFTTVPLVPLGNDVYRATIASPQCNQHPEYYFSATGTVSGPTTVPAGAPANVFSANVGTVATRMTDSFETDTGWTVLNFQSGGFTFRGPWTRGVPVASIGAPPADVDETGAGACFVTGNDNNDLDNGTTILTSPVIDISGGEALVSYSRWFFNNNPANAPEVLRVEISSDGGNSWDPFETVGPTGQVVGGGWNRVTLPVPPEHSGGTVQFRFIASDFSPDSIIEAGLDAFQVRVVSCVPGAVCQSDWNHDSSVNSSDISAYLTAWLDSVQNGNLIADFNADNAVNSGDISAFLSEWLTELVNGC